MASQMSATNDRSRTYWTPTMERYFVDLMLEQMHRGNRIGHTFNKQAWTDMLTMFNAKFGSQYDKDVLKSRYTNLWKQFNDVKNLLDQAGFSWDENRQMVVADDCIWNAYIKVHPDARSYKTKALLNFTDLCLIYGYTTADGRYSLSSHDLDFDDEVQGINMGDGMSSLGPISNERSRTEWTVAMDQYFIELLLDQVGKGNKTDNTFSKQAWTDMLVLFNAKFGAQHGKRVLRHRYKKLWKYFSDVKVLLKQDGFSWDETQQMLAANDSVWDAYIKAHPHARAYRMKTLPNYIDLALIYGDTVDNEISSHLHQDNELEICNVGIKAGEGKGSQTPNVNDRTRTYWTPPMDRYLIDLLLEQVDRGNKLGQTFISQAWNDMITAFNEKFRSHHDKDVLKNRYKHLRRLYNEIKNLLQHSGFSWDETRDMVTAEDHIWDAYIKEHPDARSYRVKTVPSYLKLCVIFGEEIYDGRYNRLAQTIDSNCEIPVLMTVFEKNDDLITSINPFETGWTPPMEQYFIDLLLEQWNEGNKINHSFNEQSWDHIVEAFNTKFGLHFDKYILENQCFCLMKQHEDICNLLQHSGFSWDETQQMVIGDDIVWETYIKEYPNAISYRNKFLGNFGDLCKIYGNEVFNGGQEVQDMGVEPHNETLELEIQGISGELQNWVEDDLILDQHRKRPLSTLSVPGRSNKVQKTGKEMQNGVSEMGDVATSLISKKENKNHIAIETAISALQAIPDIDDELLLDACDLLEDERKAKMFLALDFTLRKKWLLRKLRP
ncbi:L10-interacting MYB domain-containing protein isoform X2 [Mangifera indica]|uniref:L10-interacting MYB domain-containing protein isoform X2 n=1 Tax=Mangifera indica TaxID=29780 RepID=UPI001CFB8CB6|nr:L10-interacting MYB domain-containing protein isoform X2 [Mangifera indica]